MADTASPSRSTPALRPRRIAERTEKVLFNSRYHHREFLENVMTYGNKMIPCVRDILYDGPDISRISSAAGGVAANLCFAASFAIGLFTSTIAPTYAQTPAPVATSQEQPAAAQPAEQPEVKSTKFDDWYFRCVDVKTADGKAVAQCEVAQIAQVRQGDKDVSVLTLAIARTAGGPTQQGEAAKPGLLLTALVPLNIFLPAGFAIGADGKPAIEIGYRNCNQAGCWAQQQLDAKTTDVLKKASSGEARMRLMNGQNVNVRFSLKGLTAALNELQKSGS